VKPKILVVVQEYPQVSETYIKNELDALAEHHDIEILALVAGSYPYRSRRPHLVLSPVNQQNILDYLKGFAPSVIHGHYMTVLPAVLTISQALRVPFTIRAHSFDVLGGDLAKMNLAAVGANPLFRGLLCFPFMRQRFVAAGLPQAKVLGCPPVIDVQRFRNEGPNGPDIMNVGAPAPKKNMEDFIRLSKLVPDRAFNLYGLGYETPRLMEINAKLGGKVRFIPPVDPEDMPPEYKKHAWLVYTASRTVNTVGWPMALVEAQASGVGVYIQRIREDLREYVGDAGLFFDAPEDLVDAIRTPPSDAMRRRGFEWAEQFDFRAHMPILTDLWR
jgi:glycosyltransferase involved in cell wall biosynthesis